MKKTLLSLFAFTGLLGINSSFGQCNITDEAVTTGPTNFTCQGGTTVTLATPQGGIGYYLMDSVSGIQITDEYWFQGGPINIPTGTLMNSSTLYVMGRENLPSIGLDFDGVDDYVETSLIPLISEYTVEAWVKPGDGNGAIFSWGSATTGNYTSLNVQGASGFRKLKLFVGDGISPQFQLNGSSIIDDGMWHHVALTKVGNDYTLYVDGNMEIGSPQSSTIVTTPTTSSLGGGFHNNSWQSLYTGQMDEVRYWSIARSNQDISNSRWDCELMDETGLVARYHFEDGTMSSTLTDDINGYDGTLNGMDVSTQWVDAMEICGPSCVDSMSTLVHININPIADQSVSIADGEFCAGPATTTVNLANSEPGIDYYLRDNSNDTIIDGPVMSAGGGPLALSTGTINASMEYNVYANIQNPSTGVDITGGAIFPNSSEIPYTEFTTESWYKNTSSIPYLADPCIFLVFNEVNDNPLEAVAVYADLTTGLPYIQYVDFMSGPGAPSGFGTTNILDGSFHHLALVGNATSGNYELVIDGAMEASVGATLSTWTGGFVGAFDPVTFMSGSAFGVYDDVRFWDVPKSPAQIMATKDDCFMNGAPNLMAYWPLDDAAGDLASEVSGNGLAGSLELEGSEGVEFSWTTGNTECLICEQQMSETVSVLIGDTTNPNVICQDITVQLDGNGDATISAMDVDGGSSDNCDSSPTFDIDVSMFDCDDIGTVSVTLTVTDADNNEASCVATVTIEDNMDPVISDCPTDISVNANTLGCGANVSWVAPTADDNCAVQSFTSTHETTDVFPLGVTTVTYTAEDASGNMATCSFDVTVTNDMTASAVATDADCFEASTGSIDLTVTGGTGVYYFDWDNGDDVEDPEFLDAGTFNVIIEDENECSTSTSATVSEPAEIIINATGNDPSACQAADGDIAITVTGGTVATDYSYDWSNGETTQNISSLIAGYYEVTVSDDNGCEVTTSGGLSDPNAPTVTMIVTPSILDCYGDANGTMEILVALNGGATSYTVLWDNGSTFNVIPLLPASMHSVTVTDDNNCVAVEDGEITQPDSISAMGDLIDAGCFGEMNGSINLEAFGGTEANVYGFSWDHGPTTEDVSGLAEGTYTVTVTDDNACNNSFTFEIMESDSIAGNATVSDITCFGDGDGSISLATTGGDGDYTYSWDNSETTSSITGLSAATYVVSITDGDNCTGGDSYAISEPTVLAVSGTTTNDSTGTSGGVDITVTGGTTPYSYSWDNSATTEDLTDVAGATTYAVTVTDDNGCTVSDSYAVSSNVGMVESVIFSKVYPNPAKDQLFVELNINKFEIQLTDLEGRIISTKSIENSNKTIINLEDVARGVYLIQVKENNNIHQLKVVKQ